MQKLHQLIIQVMSRAFPPIRIMYCIALNELHSETIAESICSVVGKVYAANRRSIEAETLAKHVMIRLKSLNLPSNHRKDVIVSDSVGDSVRLNDLW